MPLMSFMCWQINHNWFRQWLVAWTAPSHYLNQCWNIVNWTPGTNINEILLKIHTFSFKKIHFKMPSGKRRPFCLGLNLLIQNPNLIISELADVIEPSRAMSSAGTMLTTNSNNKSSFGHQWFWKMFYRLSFVEMLDKISWNLVILSVLNFLSQTMFGYHFTQTYPHHYNYQAEVYWIYVLGYYT